jgi:hypothetical protein
MRVAFRTLSSVGSERTPHTRKVAGSTPAASTNTFVDGIRLYAEVFAVKRFLMLISAFVEELLQSLQP